MNKKIIRDSLVAAIDYVEKTLESVQQKIISKKTEDKVLILFNTILALHISYNEQLNSYITNNKARTAIDLFEITKSNDDTESLVDKMKATLSSPNNKMPSIYEYMLSFITIKNLSKKSENIPLEITLANDFVNRFQKSLETKETMPSDLPPSLINVLEILLAILSSSEATP